MGEVMARTYASWLLWWKATINSDDYIKYLSTQMRMLRHRTNFSGMRSLIFFDFDITFLKNFRFISYSSTCHAVTLGER